MKFSTVALITLLMVGLLVPAGQALAATLIEDTDNANIYTEGGSNWSGTANQGVIYKPQVSQTTVNNICFWFGADVAGDSGVVNLDVYNRGAGNFPTGGSNTHLGTSDNLTVSPPDVDIAQHFTDDISSWEVNCFTFASPLSWNANDGIAMKINYVSGDTVYVIQGGGSGNPSNDPDFPAVSTGNIGNTGSWYGQAVPVQFWDGPPAPGGPSCLAGDFGTCINEVIPPHDIDGSNARATSTTFAFEVDGYVSPEDWVDGMMVKMEYIPNDYDQLAAAYCAVGGCWLTALDEPITADGDFDFATTTDVQRVGWYSLKTTIYAPTEIFGLGFSLWNHSVASYESDFLVATSSPIDNIKRTIGNSITSIITGTDSPTRYCQFSTILGAFSFDEESNILTCLLGVISGLTTPSASQIAAIGQNLHDSIFTRMPFGYFTRFIQIASGDVATSTLPSLTIGFPTEYGHGLGGVSGTFNLWEDYSGPTSVIATATSSASTGGKTLRQIVEPSWIMIMLSLLAIAIVFDMLRVRNQNV